MFQYQIVKKAILEELKRTGAQTGDQLPTITELCDIYGVSRLTITRALNELEQLGVVYKRRGSGTYVRGFREDGVIDVFYNPSKDVLEEGSVVTELSEDSPDIPSEVVEAGLVGDLLCFEQVYYYDGEKLCFEVTYVLKAAQDEKTAYSDGFYAGVDNNGCVMFDRVSYLSNGQPYKITRRYYEPDKWKLRVNIMN